MYLEMQKQEREETGFAAVDKETLMARRALRNDKRVIDAIERFWRMLGDLKVDDK